LALVLFGAYDSYPNSTSRSLDIEFVSLLTFDPEGPEIHEEADDALGGGRVGLRARREARHCEQTIMRPFKGKATCKAKQVKARREVRDSTINQRNKAYNCRF